MMTALWQEHRMHKAIIIGLFGVSLAVAASVLPSFADEASQALLNGKVKTCYQSAP